MLSKLVLGGRRRIETLGISVLLSLLPLVTMNVIQQADAAASFADFNGDGYEDLAIGVPNEGIDPDTAPCCVSNAGAVNVIYGSADGLSEIAAPDQFWYQGVDNELQDGPEQNDNFGQSLVAGRIGTDVSWDLAVGIPGEDIGTTNSAGAVHVIYGEQDSGLTGSEDDFVYQGATFDGGTVLGTPGDSDLFGDSLAIGKFDTGTSGDLAIGIPQEDVTVTGVTVTDAGAVSVIYSDVGGLDPDNRPNLLLHQDSPVQMEETPETDDEFGTSIVAADFNGDGKDDLAIGVPQEDTNANSIPSAGVVQVIYGSSSGLSATAGPGDQVWSQDSSGILESASDLDEFGSSLAAGRFNDDAYYDLAIGVPDEDVSSNLVEDGGLVNVIYGSASGISDAGGPGDQIWWQDSTDVEESAAENDEFGFVMSVGDYNGDGEDDLAIGVPKEDVSSNTIADGGVVNVIYGSSAANGLSAVVVGGTGNVDQLWWQSSADILESPQAGEEFGSAL